ncbi:5'/3'-nucleotidase SurE [candidate division KSB1 bacterium]|nr:5'/3'-nucleotidase SurE [candidate division KSB1 bacterium]
MNILVTNDDGIHAPGLHALVQSLKKLGKVTVVAPATEMSAVGHAITLSDPLKVKEIHKDGQFFGFAVTGTPADCVKIAYGALLKEMPAPDILVSGINLGSNTGINVIYSGTVSAATEGAILGVPSFAISLATFQNPDFSAAAKFARDMVPIVIETPFPSGVYLNINVPAVPAKEIKGIRITRQGMARYREEYHVRTDPRNLKYYWLTGEKIDIETDEGYDDRAILNNKISITPIHFDLTYYPYLDKLEKLDITFQENNGTS